MRWMLACLLFGACGSPSASFDAASANGSITVRVLYSENGRWFDGPTAGLSVVFNDPSGSRTVQTNAAGEAAAEVSGPTDVTVIEPPNGSFLYLESVLGVQPGETIELVRGGTNRSDPRPPLTVTFTPTSGVTYKACGPCSCYTSMTSPIDVGMTSDCWTNPANVSLVAMQNNAVVGYLNDPNVAYSTSTGGSVTFTGPLSPALVYGSHYTNVPSEVKDMRFDLQLAGSATWIEKTSPTPTTDLQLDGWAASPAYQLSSYSKVLGEAGQLDKIDLAPASSTQNIDVAATLLPWLDVQPTIDTTARIVHVPATSGAQGDLLTLFAYYATPGGTQIGWQVHAPGPGDIALPAISDPDVSGTGSGTAIATIYELESVAGYAQARLRPFTLRDWPRVPGRARLSMSDGY